MRAWHYVPSTGALPQILTTTASSPLPSPEPLTIRVTSMSTNPVDYKIAESALFARLMLSNPSTPGLDYSGTIVSIAPGTQTPLAVGDRVFGRFSTAGKCGTLAEYISPPLDGVAKIHAGVSDDDAAALGTAGLSALQSIAPYVNGKGEKVLLNGGSGAVGTFGIQIAKALGAHVTVTCSGANAALCRELGADEVVDYKEVDVVAHLAAKGRVYGLVVDNAGSPADLYRASNAFLKPEGAFVRVAWTPSLSTGVAAFMNLLRPAMLRGGKAKFVLLIVKNKAEDFERLGKWMQEGKLRSVIDSTFEFEDAPKAYERQRSGRARGNIIVHVSKV